MDTRRSRRLALVPLLLVVTTACAQQGEATGVGGLDSSVASQSADSVVFRLEHVGGFTTPAESLTRIPIISVYGDGRVITQGPVPLVYPGPALPNLQESAISAEEVEGLLSRARAAGVGSAVDLGRPPIADAPSTRFTVLGEKGVERFEVYALAEAADAESGLTADQRAARDKLRQFVESLTDSTGPLAEAQGAASEAYLPTAVAAVAEPWVAGADVGEQREIAWPGPALPGDDLGKDLGLGCVTVAGDAVGRLLTAAADANAATPWTSGGQRWRVTLRPLLPDETDCADLAADS